MFIVYSWTLLSPMLTRMLITLGLYRFWSLNLTTKLKSRTEADNTRQWVNKSLFGAHFIQDYSTNLSQKSQYSKLVSQVGGAAHRRAKCCQFSARRTVCGELLSNIFDIFQQPSVAYNPCKLNSPTALMWATAFPNTRSTQLNLCGAQQIKAPVTSFTFKFDCTWPRPRLWRLWV